MENQKKFTKYQAVIALLIALIQFSVVLDFMVLSPLGTFVMDDLKLQPEQFGIVVAAYAISAFVSAVLTAGFADKFDRNYSCSSLPDLYSEPCFAGFQPITGPCWVPVFLPDFSAE